MAGKIPKFKTPNFLRGNTNSTRDKKKVKGRVAGIIPVKISLTLSPPKPGTLVDSTTKDLFWDENSFWGNCELIERKLIISLFGGILVTFECLLSLYVGLCTQ